MYEGKGLKLKLLFLMGYFYGPRYFTRGYVDPLPIYLKLQINVLNFSCLNFPDKNTLSKLADIYFVLLWCASIGTLKEAKCEFTVQSLLKYLTKHRTAFVALSRSSPEEVVNVGSSPDQVCGHLVAVLRGKQA